MRSVISCLVALAVLISTFPDTASSQTLWKGCGERGLMEYIKKIALFTPPDACEPKIVDVYCRALARQSTVHLVESLRREQCLDKHGRILPARESGILSFVIAEQEKKVSSTPTRNPLLDVVRVQSLPGVHYLTIMNFLAEDAFEQIEEALRNVNPQDRIIVDLRGNLGGRDLPALKAAGLFAPRAGMTLAVERSRVGAVPFVTQSRGRLFGNPVLVLVDENTASAAEIFTAAVRYVKPTSVSVMGRQTYGKASFQTAKFVGYEVEITVTAGEVTVGPYGLRIDGVGLTPDYILTEEFMRGGSYSLTDPVVLHALKYHGFFGK